jgi:hypothetical protein
VIVERFRFAYKIPTCPNRWHVPKHEVPFSV